MKRIWPVLILVFLCGLQLAPSLPAQAAESEDKSDQPVERKPRHNRKPRVHHADGKELVAVGNSVVLKEGETSGDVVVVGGSATIDGAVNGDLVVVLGSATLGTNATVSGDLVVVAGTLQADPAAKINAS
jgi:predicted GTPase